jgi:hypothetical protein
MTVSRAALLALALCAALVHARPVDLTPGLNVPRDDTLTAEFAVVSVAITSPALGPLLQDPRAARPRSPRARP